MSEPEFVRSGPLALLRIEGLVLVGAAFVGYWATGKPWWWVLPLVLVPDLAMLGYLASSRVGALCYNLAHTYLLPALLGGAGLLADSPLVQALALVWFVHIGVDRAAGYGLKYASGFKDTHLGHIGRRRSSFRT